MPPRRSAESQSAREDDIPTNAELAQAVRQLAQLTQAIGDRMLQNPQGNGNGNDMANNSRERCLEKERERVKKIICKVQRNQRAERHYNCKRCNKDHPGVDCQGNVVKCFNCNKMGHRAFECYAKKNGNPSWQNQNRNGGNNGKNLGGGNQNNQNGNRNGEGSSPRRSVAGSSPPPFAAGVEDRRRCPVLPPLTPKFWGCSVPSLRRRRSRNAAMLPLLRQPWELRCTADETRNARMMVVVGLTGASSIVEEVRWRLMPLPEGAHPDVCLRSLEEEEPVTAVVVGEKPQPMAIESCWPEFPLAVPELHLACSVLLCREGNERDRRESCWKMINSYIMYHLFLVG
nr:probable serine/threonine-protein kinase clkA [Ipomoea batatas]